jgi:hypothetical protein
MDDISLGMSSIPIPVVNEVSYVTFPNVTYLCETPIPSFVKPSVTCKCKNGCDKNCPCVKYRLDSECSKEQNLVIFKSFIFYSVF